MINNDTCVLVTLKVKYWSGYKHDKQASTDAIEANRMETGSGKFNKKLLPKFCLKEIKTVIDKFKAHFNDNTLPYNALLGTRILPTDSFVNFQKVASTAVEQLNKAVAVFITDYEENRRTAQKMLGDLYRIEDYPLSKDLPKKFLIELHFFPVPETTRFNSGITNVQVQKLSKELDAMSMSAKFDLVYRTEKIARTLMHTLLNANKRIFHSTVTGNIDKLSEQLANLNYDNDPLITEVKSIVDKNIKDIRVDHLKESPTYRDRIIKQTQNVIDLVMEIHESNPNS